MICKNISAIIKILKLPGYSSFNTKNTEERRKKKWYMLCKVGVQHGYVIAD
jgi:hypothetical protein